MSEVIGHVAPKWSIVIPLFNKADYIEATVLTALNQSTCRRLEVVLVDDGSTDNGLDKVRAISDSRLKIVEQANAGVSAARNRGITESKGEWVVFLDADDLLHPSALMAYEQLSDMYPGANMLGGKDVRVQSQELVAGYDFEELPNQVIGREIVDLPKAFVSEGLPFSSSSVAIRRDFLRRHKLCFPVGESMGEDIDLWLRAAELTSVACTSAPLVAYRVGLATSLMGSYRDLEFLPVWQRLRQRALSGSLSDVLKKSSLRLAAEMEITLARRLAMSGRTRDAWRHLINAKAAIFGYRWWYTAVGLMIGFKLLWRRKRG